MSLSIEEVTSSRSGDASYQESALGLGREHGSERDSEDHHYYPAFQNINVYCVSCDGVNLSC